MKCPACGSNVQEGSLFCPHCRFQFNSTDIPIDENPNPLLRGILITLEKNALSQRYTTLCTLYIALSAIIIATIPNLNNPNFLLVLVGLGGALIPVTVIALLMKK
jgi:uncharacterized membrane protein YvbJ